MEITLRGDSHEVASFFGSFGAARDCNQSPTTAPAPPDPEVFRDLIREVVLAEAGHVLKDVEFRVGQAYEVERRTAAGEPAGTGKVYAEDLAVMRHQITGYTVTANSPTAGKIAWASVHVVYNGTDYTITDGNTDKKYAWFDATTSTTVLQVSDTKPTLTGNAALLFINNGGVPLDVLNSSIAGAVMDNAVDSGALQANAVTSTAIASNAVVAGKINAGAVNNSNIFAQNVVNTNAIASGAVTTTELGAGAVTDVKLGDNAVTSAKIGAGAVIAGKIGVGAVTTAKLNVLRHLLY